MKQTISEGVNPERCDNIVGCMLGTAIGDAMGLAYENISPLRARRMLGSPDSYRFLFGRGMISDDTEHTCIVAQSLIASEFKAERFGRELGRRLRSWFLSFPAGIGMGTVKACAKLCLFVSFRRSGIFSAGNGPAMRSAIIGAAVDDTELLKSLINVSTRITHTDPKAEYGALAVALAANMAAHYSLVDPEMYLSFLREELPKEADELLFLLQTAVESVNCGCDTSDFACFLGLENGVSGYVYNTVPVAIHSWLSNQHDFRNAVKSIIKCGGDADTTASIVGGIVGAGVGHSGLPKEWIDNIFEWPCSTSWIESLGIQLAKVITSGEAERPLQLFRPFVILRNLFFLLVVLLWGFRRLAPPY